MDKNLSLKEKVSELKATSSKARALIANIIDDKSFVEFGALSFSSNDTFANEKVDGEGVVTGYGTIDGIPVYLYVENFEVLQGGFGKAQADKIVNLLDMAEKTGTPVISVLDSAGARLGEGLSLLEGYAKVLKKSADLAGVVPQISIINGKAFGGISYISAMSDITFMMENSLLSSCGPMVLQAKENVTESFDSLVGAKTHATKSGINAMTLKSEQVKPTLVKVLDLLLCEGDEVEVSNLGKISLNSELSMDEKVKAIVDENSAIELYSDYVNNARTYLARMGGQAVGIVTVEKALCGKMAKKAKKFVCMLDDYNIPLITLVDSNGIYVSKNAEQDGMIDDITSLAFVLGESNIPKISVVCGEAVGMSYSILASKSIGFDYSLAWTNAFISTLPSSVGAEIAYIEDIKNAKDKEKAREDAIKAYATKEADVFVAGKGGFVDNIIEPALTRPYIISALSMLKYKSVSPKNTFTYPL